MNVEMVKRWNSIVKPDGALSSILIMSVFWPNALSESYYLLNGEKHLIMGNHDPCHPCQEKAEAGREIYTHAGF